jgi:hypothetical protein
MSRRVFVYGDRQLELVSNMLYSSIKILSILFGPGCSVDTVPI